MKEFSIISYFDNETTKEICNLQKEISEITGSSGAFKNWIPHITVGSGIQVEDSELNKLFEEINSFVENINLIEIKIKDFYFMDDWVGSKLGLSPYVVSIQPYEYEELNILVNFFENNIKQKYRVWYEQSLPYNPHITIAYADLKKESFEKAKEYLKDRKFEKTIILDNVCLAIKDNEGKWQEYKRFKIN